jgi:hypothetical protein
LPSIFRRRLIRRRDGSCVRAQSPVHSAHRGAEVEVHYRWHPLYGRRVCQQYSEQRAGGRVVHVEASPGVIVVLADWMFDCAACSGMEKTGAPRVDVATLRALARLLADRGFRRNSSCDPRIAREVQNAQNTQVGPRNADGAASGRAPTQHHVRVRPIGDDESARARESSRSLGGSPGASGGSRDKGERR